MDLGFNLSNVESISVGGKEIGVMHKSKSSEIISDNYARATYLQSHGLEWIEIDYTTNINTKIDVEFSTTSDQDNTLIIGTNWQLNAFLAHYFWSNDNQLARVYVGSKIEVPLSFDGQRHNIHMENRKAVIDGIEYPGSDNVTLFSTVKIFGLIDGTIYNRKSSQKVYSCKIYDSSVLVRDLVPSMRIYDGVAGLYDNVTGKFYENKGSGSFTCDVTKNDVGEIFFSGKKVGESLISRTSADGLLIKSEAEAKCVGIEGNTIIWNQLSGNSLPINLSVDNTKGTSVIQTQAFWFNVNDIESTHKLLIRFKYTINDKHIPNNQNSMYFYQNDSMGTFLSNSKLSNPVGTYYEENIISYNKTSQQSSNQYIYLKTDIGTYNNLTIDELCVFDLTRMFGSDSRVYSALGVSDLNDDSNKRIAIYNFKRLFPLKGYDYEQGCILDFKLIGKWNGLNQLIQNGNFADSSNGWNITTNSTMTAVDNVATVYATADGNNYAYQTKPMIIGHKYAFSSYAKSDASNNGMYGLCVYYGSESDVYNQEIDMNWKRYSTIFTCVGNDINRICLQVMKTGYNQYRNIQLVDLTNIFGLGNEPSTVAEFDAWMMQHGINPDIYRDYVEGTTFESSRIKSNSIEYEKNHAELPQGYQQIEWLQAFDGAYINTLVYPDYDTRIELSGRWTGLQSSSRSLLGTQATTIGIYFTGTSNWCYTVYFGASGDGYYGTSFGMPSMVGDIIYKWDRDKLTVSGLVDITINYSNKTVVPSKSFYQPYIWLFRNWQYHGGCDNFRCYYMKIWSNDTIVRDFIPCKNESGIYGLYDLVNGSFYSNPGTGYLTGGVVLKSSCLNLPQANTDIIIRSAGSIRDEIVGKKIYRKVGTVNLGNLDWYRNANATYPYFYAIGTNFAWKGNYSNISSAKYNVLDNRITTLQFGNGSGYDKCMAMNTGTNILMIRDSSYNSISDFKTSLSGVYINYELLEQSVEEMENYWNDHYVSYNQGTETLLPENLSVPYTSSIKPLIRYKNIEPEAIYTDSSGNILTDSTGAILSENI